MEAISLYTKYTEDIDKQYDELKKVIESTGVAPEGNCLYYHRSLHVYPELINKRANLLWLSQAQDCKRVLEIGFNAGHSAVLLLLLNSAEATFFDIGEHPYMRPCFDYIQRTFTNKVDLIVGDSLKTLPPYADSHAGEFDLVHVDGGHSLECFTNDFNCALKLVRVGGIIIADDTNIPYINEYLNSKIREGVVEEVKDLLFTVGYEHRVVRRVM